MKLRVLLLLFVVFGLTQLLFAGGSEVWYGSDRLWVADTLKDGEIKAVVVFHGWGAPQALDRNHSWRAFAERNQVLLFRRGDTAGQASEVNDRIRDVLNWLEDEKGYDHDLVGLPRVYAGLSQAVLEIKKQAYLVEPQTLALIYYSDPNGSPNPNIPSMLVMAEHDDSRIDRMYYGTPPTYPNGVAVNVAAGESSAFMIHKDYAHNTTGDDYFILKWLQGVMDHRLVGDGSLQAINFSQSAGITAGYDHQDATTVTYSNVNVHATYVAGTHQWMPNLETANEYEQSYDHPYVYWLDASRSKVKINENVNLTARIGDPNINSGDSISYTISKITGPGNATIGNATGSYTDPIPDNTRDYSSSNELATEVATTVRFDQEGVYTLEIEVTDASNHTATKTVQIHAVDGPEVTLSTSNNTVVEGGSSATITATLSAIATRDVTVTFEVAGAYDLKAADYALSASSVTIPQGSLTGSVTFNALSDALVEGDQLAQISISDVTNAAYEEDEHVDLVIEDANAFSEVNLAASKTSFYEDEAITVTVTLANPLDEGVMTADMVMSGTAKENTDYVLTRKRVQIPAGATSFDMTITPVDDLNVEGFETIVVGLENISFAVKGSSFPLSLNVLDNDYAVPALTWNTDSFVEHSNNDGSIAASALVTLDFDTFTADAVSGGHIMVHNVPQGLSAQLNRDNDTQISLTLSGNATEHDVQNAIDNLLVEFSDDAFSSSIAANVRGYQSVLSVTFNGNLLPSGLKLWWKYDEGTGTSLVDSSFNGNDGVLAGNENTWVTGVVGSGISCVSDFFGGTSFARGAALRGPVNTIAFWFKSDSTLSGDEIMTAYSGSGNTNWKINVGDRSGTTDAESISIVSDYSSDTYITTPLSQSVWYHVALAWNGSSYDIYLDGVQQNTSTSNGHAIQLDIVNSGLYAFGNKSKFSRTFNFDDLMIFDTVLSGAQVATIYNNAVFPTVNIDDQSVTEGDAGNATVTFAVTLSQALTTSASVEYRILGGTAVHGSDYVNKSGTITFAAGQTSQTIGVDVMGDTEYEHDETFNVILSNPINAVIGDGVGTATITNDDTMPTVSLSSTPLTISENGGTATVTATLSDISGVDVRVHLLWGGTALESGIDYHVTAPSIIIPAGSLTGQVALTSIADARTEGNETIDVSIDSIEHATENGTQQVTCSIVDVIVTAEVLTSVSSISVPENGTAHFTVTLSAPADESVAIDVIGDSDISLGSVSPLTFTTSNWDVPQTVTLTAANDADLVSSHATILLSGANLLGASVAATEADDDADLSVISLNFGADQQSLSANDEAGLVANKNWTNLSGNNSSATDLVDDSGNATTADVTWNSDGTWSSSSNSSNGDEKMMRGYLDIYSSTPGVVSLTQIPYAHYDLYIYHQGDTDGRGGSYTVSGAGTLYAKDFSGSFSGSAADYVLDSGTSWATSTGGHYVKFSGLTSADITIDAGVSDMRNVINGIQVVEQVGTPIYTLTVNNGSGGSVYAENTVVSIRATVPANQQFVNWTGDVAHVADVNNASTTLTMPGSSVMLTANFSSATFATWATALGVSTTPTADDDGDGMNNFVEYALGQNPKVTTTSALGRYAINGSGTSTYTFIKPIPAVSYKVQHSPDLVNWTDYTGVETDHGSEVSVEISTTLMANTKLFIRLLLEE